MKSHPGLSRFAAFFAALVGAACISLLAGCGQTGALYMPGTKMPKSNAPPAIPAPVAAPAPASPASK
ncbi:lipoprotein [Herminiimonas sp.]|uniref:LPS translocon maturation chaperone LptM n=1 Tax=Herminiimonas sp. TaxID=1926289 RepID=UPI0027194907|nr:lipoprotein [Herminiimonas sp.]MDO8306705.1 lipoprotein [Herminiimonas sp.]